MSTISPHLGSDQDTVDFLDADVDSPIDQSRGFVIETLCPFCGTFNQGVGNACRSCQKLDTPEARRSTIRRVEPWFVMQSQQVPSQGMPFQSLQSLIRRQFVNARSVVRGPATGQLWRLASKVRGVAREFGQCYSCGEDIDQQTTVCPQCRQNQTLPADDEAWDDIPAAISNAVASFDSAVAALSIAAPVESDTAEVREQLLDMTTRFRPEPLAVDLTDDLPVIKPVTESTVTPEPISNETRFVGTVAGITETAPAVEPLAVTMFPVVELPAEMLNLHLEETEQPTERNELLDRHIPKDDLLTARDVAKAFMLEFGSNAIAPPRQSQAVRRWGSQQIKIAGGIAAALLMGAMVWTALGKLHESAPTDNAPASNNPAIAAVSPGSISSPFVSPAPVTFADARLAAEVQTPVSPNQPLVIDPPVRTQPVVGDSEVKGVPEQIQVQSNIPVIKAAVITPAVSSAPMIHATPFARPAAPIVEPGLVSANDDPKALFAAALDAESRGRYAEAVAVYDKLESLPSDQWPAHLQVRKALAQRALSGDNR